MKTEEDEAFDELAKRQGDWGGGFKAKRAMAADKLQEPVQEPMAQREWVGLTPEDILALFDEHNLYGSKLVEFARAVETKLKDKNI